MVIPARWPVPRIADISDVSGLIDTIESSGS